MLRGELIRGVLSETTPTGHEHGVIVVNLVTELRGFIKPGKLGALTASDSGVWLDYDPDTVREPDIAYVSARRIPLDQRITGYAEVVPDLVVEFASPGNSRRELNDKPLMWLSFGVRLVRVGHPDSRTVDVHRPETAASTLTRNDSLDGHDAFPGFSCQDTEISPPSSLPRRLTLRFRLASPRQPSAA